MRRFVLVLFVLLLPSLAQAQPFSSNIQRIGTSDGTHIDAASPLPVSATIPGIPAAIGPQTAAGVLPNTITIPIGTTDAEDRLPWVILFGN